MAELQIKAETAPLAIDDLKTADEAFITSTAGGIMPVGRIDGEALRAGPGPVTTRLKDLYWVKHMDLARSVAVDDLSQSG